MDNVGLRVSAWVAVEAAWGDLPEKAYGTAEPAPVLRSGAWRRMGQLERLAVRATQSLLGATSTDCLIFCSRYGSVGTLVGMLRNIAEDELLSPIAFSGSVHNAAPGMVGQIRNERLGHTAIAGGSDSLAAGLIEAYVRLADGECEDVALTYADLPLPEPFAEFDEEDGPGLAVSLRLDLGECEDGAPSIPIAAGREGLDALLCALNGGARHLSVGGGIWSGAAH